MRAKGVPNTRITDPKFQYAPVAAHSDPDYLKRKFFPAATDAERDSQFNQILDRVAKGTSTVRDAVALSKELNLQWIPR